jgi:hypothetical protein
MKRANRYLTIIMLGYVLVSCTKNEIIIPGHAYGYSTMIPLTMTFDTLTQNPRFRPVYVSWWMVLWPISWIKLIL